MSAPISLPPLQWEGVGALGVLLAVLWWAWPRREPKERTEPTAPVEPSKPVPPIVGVEMPSALYALVPCAACGKTTWVLKERDLAAPVVCPSCAFIRKATLTTTYGTPEARAPAPLPMPPPPAPPVVPTPAPPEPDRAVAAPPAPVRLGWLARRRKARAETLALAGMKADAAAKRERGRRYVLTAADEHDLAQRFKAWDDAEHARVAADLVSDLKIVFPDATDDELARFIRDLRISPSERIAKARKVP